MFQAELSPGFCTHVVTLDPFVSGSERGVNGPASLTAPLWQQPSVQLIDVQIRPVPNSDSDQVAHVLYLAISDGDRLAWAIVPPRSPIEQLLLDREVEPGALLTLHDYGVVRAANGRNVIVLIDVSCDPMRLSLIGTPTIDAALFKLSPFALVHAAAEVVRADKERQTSGRSSRRASEARALALPPVTLEECWNATTESGDGAPTAGRLVVRVVWKSRLRKVMSGGRQPSQQQQQDKTPLKFVFDIKVVDPRGTGATIVIWGPRRRYDLLAVGDVVWFTRVTRRLVEETVKCLEANERSVLGFLARQAGAMAIDAASDSNTVDDTTDAATWNATVPTSITTDLCPVHTQFATDFAVIRTAELGQTLSVLGVIQFASPIAGVQTRNGRVDRRNVTIRMHTAADDRRRTSAGPVSITVTLWGPIAHSSSFDPDTLFCFRDFKVGMFGSERTLSSKSSSEVFPRHVLLGYTAAAHQEEVLPTNAAPTADQSCHPRADGETADDPLRAWSRAESALPAFVDSFASAADGEAVLVRIMDLQVPFHFVACATCGRRAATATHCAHCGLTNVEMRFALRMWLSDGVDCLSAVAFAGVAEAVVGCSAADFAVALESDPGLSTRVMEHAVGASLVVRILPTLDGDRHLFDVSAPPFATLGAALLKFIAMKTRRVSAFS